MAIQTRYAGDVNPTINVDGGLGVSQTGTTIATGLTKVPFAIKVAATNLGVGGEMNTGGAVETILRSIGIDSTIVMYQVDSGQVSVLLEASGATTASGDSSTSEGFNASYGASDIASALQTRLRALTGAASAQPGPTGSTVGGNIGLAGNVWAAGITVTSSGFKLA